MNSRIGDDLPRSIGACPYPGGTEFRVWATNPQRVEVEIFLDDGTTVFHDLESEDGGYFGGFIRDILPGTRYKYRLNGRDSFPDPASRYQPEGVHGPSQVVDPEAFRWNDDSWHGIELDKLVIYELHVGTFTEEGTFDALRDRLDYIHDDLGATAIQLMPVADFPGERDWGYSGACLFAPARAYGGPEALRRLVDDAHVRGLAVILDVVFNHLGPEGNYLEMFSKSYFTDDHGTAWGKGIHFVGSRARPVRDFFVANARYWAHEYHVDGLRLDAIQAIRDADDPHIIQEICIDVRASLPQGRSFVIIAEDEYNNPLLVQPIEKRGFGLDAVYADDFHHQLHVALTNEKTGYYMDYDGTVNDLVATLQQGWWFIGQVSQWRSKKKGEPLEVGYPADVVSPPHFIYCTQNHDQVGNRPFGERLNHLVKPDVYRASSALLLLSPYTPLLFMGQEWAASTPFLFFTDFRDENAIQGVRKGRPEFMDDLFPGCGDQTLDPQDLQTFLRSKIQWREQIEPSHAGILRLYRDLLRLRRDLPALQARERKDFQLEKISAHALALRRRGPTPKDTLLIIVNLRGRLRYHLNEFITAPPERNLVWEPRLDTENPTYGGRGDTHLAEGRILEMSGAGALLLIPLPAEDAIPSPPLPPESARIVGSDATSGSALPATQSSSQPRPGIDYHLATIRQLLLAAFTPQTLRRFCQDRPLFQPIVYEFGPEHGLGYIVDRVIDYCNAQLIFDELLTEIEKENPKQYERFEPYQFSKP